VIRARDRWSATLRVLTGSAARFTWWGLSLLVTLTACAGEPSPQSAERGAAAVPKPDALAPGAFLPGSALDSLDLVVSGLAAGADPAAVTAALGAPDSVRTFGNPFVRDSDDIWGDWFYPGLTVHLTSELLWSNGMSLVDPTHATRRGVRVGDARQRVREVYGEPEVVEGRWYYSHPDDVQKLLVLAFSFDADRVQRIFLGHLLD
jgi:hypothetical protein